MIQQHLEATHTIKKQRLNCSVCNYRINPEQESAFTDFPCAIRAFKEERFKVWRCPDCQTIHCLDIVDLDHYFAQYKNADAKLTWIDRLLCHNLYTQLAKHGFSKTHSLLDYGCGPNGLFVQYLKQAGFQDAYGYDLYGTLDGFGNPEILQRGLFDYISMQYVIQHIEDPYPVLRQLNNLLSPGGYIFIGTPNAANIDLSRPDLADHYNPVDAPYQPHIYTRETLENLGKAQGWEPVDFFDRKYDDTPWFGFNHRAYNLYMSLFDGYRDTLLEPLKLWKAFSSPKFIFYAMFGYWLSTHNEMGIMFRKKL